MKRGQILTPAVMLTASIMIIVAIIFVLLLLPITRDQLTEPTDMKDNETRGGTSCVLTKAYWTKNGQQVTQASEGNILELNVESQNCKGQIIEFEVWTGTSLIETSEKIIVTSDMTSVSWRAPATESIYGAYFIAKLQGSALSIKSPTLSVNPKIEIDPNETEINETEINETEVNTTEPTSYECPYGNDETSYSTCQFSYMLQNKFSDQTFDHAGINDRIKATSVNGGWVLASSGHTVDKFLSFSRGAIKNKFLSAFNPGEQFEGIDPTTTTDLYIIDIEYPVRMQEMFDYYNQSPGKYSEHTFEEIVGAVKLRLDVMREVMPNAKIALYGVVIPNGITDLEVHDYVDEQAIGHVEAGKLEMFDSIDYISPQIYTHACKGDIIGRQWRYENIPEQAEVTIRAAARVKNSTNHPMDMAPILAHRIYAPAGYNKNKTLCGGSIQTTEAIRWQVDVLQKYDQVKVITFWSGGEEEIVAWFEEAKLVPEECFCTKEFNLPPRAHLVFDPKEGFDPLTVKLTLKDILDPEGESISYRWHFEGYSFPSDTVDARGVGPYTHEYIGRPKRNWYYNPVIWLEDSGGRKSVAQDWLRVLNSS